MTDVEFIAKKKIISDEESDPAIWDMVQKFRENGVRATLEQAPESFPFSPYSAVLITKGPHHNIRSFPIGRDHILDGNRQEVGSILVVDFNGHPRVLEEHVYDTHIDATPLFIEDVSMELILK